MAFAGRHDEELLDRRLLDGLGDRVLEVLAEVTDGLALDLLGAFAIQRLVGVDLLNAQELAHLRLVFELEAMPIDDGVPAQDETQASHVHERQLVEGFDAIDHSLSYSKSSQLTVDSSQPLRASLAHVLASVDRAARMRADPVSFVHRYSDPLDQEIVGLLASSLAFGNVKTIRAKVGEVLDRIGSSPVRASSDLKLLQHSLRGWKHRVFRGDDVAKLIYGAGELQRAHGSLGALFSRSWKATGDLREAIAEFVTALRVAGGLKKHKTRRGPSHLLPDAKSKSAMKRFLLFLRWMVRPADGVDLGLWSKLVPASALVIPVDVHIHKLARNIGLTKRRLATWDTAVEITAKLADFDADDPVRFDFALCHMGMLQRCPSRKDEKRCDGCPVKPVCIHW